MTVYFVLYPVQFKTASLGLIFRCVEHGLEPREVAEAWVEELGSKKRFVL